ncbi:MAG: hypothetical protein IPK82_08970 [Polyangiaceae bacterium]|nr:hypothetical protein [Polyangiaceae bacterium]
MRGALSIVKVTTLGAIAALTCIVGCDGGELFVPTGGAAGSAGNGGTTSQGGGGTAGQGATTSQGGGGTTSQGGSGGTAGTAGTGGSPGICEVDTDCDALFGPAACGTWACTQGQCGANSAGCTDDDHDGYGVGPNCQCAGLDCDDGTPLVTSTDSKPCYSGDPTTINVGSCHEGTTTCLNGIWSPCGGEVIPSGEACNNQDDNCDGTADNNLGSFTCGLGACQKTVMACANGTTTQCIPNAPAANIDGPACNGVDDDCDGAIDEDCKSCVAVSLNAVGVSPDGTFLNPFPTIQAAIDWAVAHPAGPQTVCVAAGGTCGQTGIYKSATGATITMSNGVSVLGNYESTTWNRCNNSTTVIQPQTAEGVTFPATVQKTTVLDGFKIDRFNSGPNGGTAGITVNGAVNVIISNVGVPELGAVNTLNSYGVNMINGADAIITKSRIDAGLGSSESIGVRVIGSHVAIQNNCLSLDGFGRCDDFCGNNPSIRGRTIQGPGATYAVLLQDSPKSTVETSALCATDADAGAAIRVAGDGNGILVRGNFINAFGGLNDSHGIWMEDCADAAPWIVDNYRIATTGDNQMSRVDAIRAVGSCHPVVDSNVQITGGGEGNAANPTGVYCGANAQGTASKCVVLGNRRIEGSVNGFPNIATGVRCDDGGCNRIEKNVITGRGGLVAYGLWLGSTGTFVNSNEIRGGCAGVATGVRTDDAYARLQNNSIFGYTDKDCGVGGSNGNPTESVGLRVSIKPGAHEPDVHSNNIDGAGTTLVNSCMSRAVFMGLVAGSGAAKQGIFRNNILRGGICPASRVGFFESDPGSDPRIVQNNNFDPIGAPMSLYFDENATSLTTAAAIDALMDITVAASLSADPLFANYPTDIHLLTGSPCVGAGTATGVPMTDFEGTPRSTTTPDIGADEQ